MFGFRFVVVELDSIVVVNVWSIILMWYAVATILSYSIQYLCGARSVKAERWSAYAVLGFANLLFSTSIICEIEACFSDPLISGFAIFMTMWVFVFWVIRHPIYSDSADIMTLFGLSFGVMAAGLLDLSGAYIFLAILLAVLVVHLAVKLVEVRFGRGKSNSI